MSATPEAGADAALAGLAMVGEAHALTPSSRDSRSAVSRLLVAAVAAPEAVQAAERWRRRAGRARRYTRCVWRATRAMGVVVSAYGGGLAAGPSSGAPLGGGRGVLQATPHDEQARLLVLGEVAQRLAEAVGLVVPVAGGGLDGADGTAGGGAGHGWLLLSGEGFGSGDPASPAQFAQRTAGQG